MDALFAAPALRRAPRPVAPSPDAERMHAVAAAAAGLLNAETAEAVRDVLEAACRRMLPLDVFTLRTFDGDGRPAAATPEGRAVRHRRTVRPRSAAALHAPILSGADVLGLLSLRSHAPLRYSRRDAEVIEVIASLAATALARIRLAAERAAAEAARHLSETRFRAMFEQFPLSVQIFDPEGRTLAVNRAWEQLYGMTLADVRDFNPLHEPQLAPVRGCLERGFGGEEVTIPAHPFKSFLPGREQEQWWLEVTVCPVRNAEGRIREVILVHRDVTAQKEAEAALQRAHAELERRVEARTAELAERTFELAQAEQRFRAIVEASPVPLLLSRITDGRILYANDRLETLLGVLPGTLVEHRTPDFYADPADRPVVLDAIFRQGYVRDLALRLRRVDGSERWVSLSAQQLVFDGAPAVATSLIDITERKQTEEALRASEESYRSLFNNLTELVYVQDLEGRFINVNEAVVRAYGYTRAELIGQTPALLADPDRVDLAATLEGFRRAVEGVPQRFDWWARRKDGTFFPKEISLNRSTYFGQDVVIAVGRDVTERVEAEEALRRREAHFRRLIEDGSDIIAVVGLDGRMRYISPSAERLLGYRLDERLGQRSDELLHPDDAAVLRTIYAELQADPEASRRFEFRFCHKDGRWRTLEGILRPLLEAGEVTGTVINARDVTERVQAERTLRLQKALLEAQGEASIDGILVVGASGEILSYNHRFGEIWGLPEEDLATMDDAAALATVLDRLEDPDAFLERVAYLYAHPDETARDEVMLRDGRVFDRYSAPVVSSRGDHFGRIWFFRDVTAQRRYEQGLERELEIGRQIQRSFLPELLPCPPGWTLAARFRPASQVAGDFYDAFGLSAGRLAIVIADVCGKGVGAALFMALFRSLLRAYAERASLAPDGTPAPDAAILTEALEATNSYITRLHRSAHTFASVFFGLLDPATGVLHYVNAGHEPPVVVGPAGPGARLTPTGPAVGLLAEAPFGVRQTTLAPGQQLLAFTDGVTEARSEARALFTEERLLTLLSRPAPTATALLDRVEAAVREHAGTAPPSDDLTLLALRRLAG